MNELNAILIGGAKRCIVSWERLAFDERACKAGRGVYKDVLTQLQYNSILFGNLGYKKCPKDLSWIEMGIPVEDVNKTEDLDTNNITTRALFIRDECTLGKILEISANFIKGGVERGNIINPESLSQKDSKDIQFNMDHNLEVGRNFTIMSKMVYWDKNNLFIRRLFNITPNIDKEYFKAALSKFADVIRYVKLENPYIIFTAMIIDPDIVLNLIREAEIEATNVVCQRFNTNRENIEELKIEVEFIKIITLKLRRLYNIYNRYGIAGFNTHRENNDVLGNVEYHILPQPFVNTNTLINNARRDTIQYWSQEVLAQPLSGRQKDRVYANVDRESCMFLEEFKTNPDYESIYKNLYLVLDLIDESNPELLVRSNKLVFSRSFYVNPEIFALYDREAKEYFAIRILINPLRVEYANIKLFDMVKYYKDRYGLDTSIDQNEVGDIFSEPVDVEFYNNWMDEMEGIQRQPVTPLPYIIPTPQPNIPILNIPSPVPPVTNQNTGTIVYGFNESFVNTP